MPKNACCKLLCSCLNGDTTLLASLPGGILIAAPFRCPWVSCWCPCRGGCGD